MKCFLNLDCSYEYFVDELYKQLNLKSTSRVMMIKYVVKSGSIPIYNGMRVRIYIEVKKKNWVSMNFNCVEHYKTYLKMENPQLVT